MSQLGTTAHTLRCDGCGGVIPLAALAQRAACPYCGRDQALDPRTTAELAQYQARVAGELARADAARSQAATWETWYGGRGAQKSGIGTSMLVFGAMLVMMVVLGIVAQALMTSGDPALVNVAVVYFPIGIGFVFVATMTGYMVWWYGGSRRKASPATLTHTRARCPRCGAENALAPGQVLERCSHCGTTLLPSKSMLDRGFGEAEAARYRAELERYRAERRGMAALLRSSAANVIPYVVIGSFLPMTLGIAIALTADAIQKGVAEPGIAALWAIAGVNVSAIMVVVLWRRSVSERVGAAIETAAAPFPHHALAGIDGLVGWLNAHWAGPIALTEISAGPQFRAVSLVIGEFVAMIALNPVAFAQGYPGYVTLFLPAWIPALHGRGHLDPRVVEPRRAALAELGFGLFVETAGLRLFADETRARALVKSASGGPSLTRAATTLVELARALHAAPLELPSDG